MKNRSFILITFFLCVMLISCKKDEQEQSNNSTPTTPANYSQGRFYINEGSFVGNNASISYESFGGAFISDLFFDVNGVGLGDVLQSATWINGEVYAVLNNSAKVEVINQTSFERTHTITGVDYPRYMLDCGNGKAYLTNGAMAGEVKVIDLASHSITGSIAVGNGPERMCLVDQYAVVCNSGGWLRDSILSVIDINTNNVVHSIDLTDRPVSVVKDANNDVWVLCSGETVYNADYTQIIEETPAQIHHIDTDTWTITASYVIGAEGEHPFSLATSPDGETIYYVNGGIYSLSIDSPAVPGTLLVSEPRNSVTVDVNGDLWAPSVNDFINPSVVYHYNSTGSLLGTRTCGLGTSAVVVRN